MVYIVSRYMLCVDAFYWGSDQELSTRESDVHKGEVEVNITFEGW